MYWSVAQLVEQAPVKRPVTGSSPVWPAIYSLIWSYAGVSGERYIGYDRTARGYDKRLSLTAVVVGLARANFARKAYVAMQGFCKPQNLVRFRVRAPLTLP